MLHCQAGARLQACNLDRPNYACADAHLTAALELGNVGDEFGISLPLILPAS